MTRSLLPPIWNDELVLGTDRVVRDALDGVRLGAGDVSVLGITADPLTNTTDDDGIYLGPISWFPYYAEETGNLLYTQDWVTVIGESRVRQALGDRIVPDRIRWSRLLAQNAGKESVIHLIGELLNYTMSVAVGVFDKTRPAKPDWVLRPTLPPSGMDITLAAVDAPSAAEITYLETVIPRYIHRKFADIRIQVVAVQAFGIHTHLEILPQQEAVVGSI